MRNSPYQKDPATSSNQWAHSQTDDAASPATARSQPSNTHRPSPTPRPLSIPSASTARPWNHPSLKLKPRLRSRGPDRRKLIRSQRRQDQLLLRNKTQNRAPAGTTARKVCRPLSTFLQINNSARRQPSAQPRARGERLPHGVERRGNRHLQNQNLIVCGRRFDRFLSTRRSHNQG